MEMLGGRELMCRYYRQYIDPPGLPRFWRPRKVRIMLPMSIQCDTCENYICRGTKLSSRKKEVVGETHLGIKTFRFYFKCTKCSAVLSIKTAPQDRDYVVESGATRVVERYGCSRRIRCPIPRE